MTVFIRRQIISMVTSGIIILIVKLAMPLIAPQTYLSWAVLAFTVFLVACAVTVGVSLLFYKKETLGILKRGAFLIKSAQ